MDLITLIFKILEKFVPISQTEYQSMYRDADAWRQSVMLKKEEELNFFEKMYRKTSINWFWKMCFAIAYIPLVKLVFGIMNPEKDKELIFEE